VNADNGDVTAIDTAFDLPAVFPKFDGPALSEGQPVGLELNKVFGACAFARGRRGLQRGSAGFVFASEDL